MDKNFSQWTNVFDYHVQKLIELPKGKDIVLNYSKIESIDYREKEKFQLTIIDLNLMSIET